MNIKKALILYHHGLGDVIMLTPHMRHLYNRGYEIDLMCRESVKTSHLLDNCPYVNKLYIVENPWRSKLGYQKQIDFNVAYFDKLKRLYDWFGVSIHDMKNYDGCHKIDMTSRELGLDLDDKKLEVFISKETEQIVSNYELEDYIFEHTFVEFHTEHNWDPSEWRTNNLPHLNVLTSYNTTFADINRSFVFAKKAKHRVLSSSVFVHACEAMGCVIDVINYGRPDRKVWPLDQEKILHIREAGEWIK